MASKFRPRWARPSRSTSKSTGLGRAAINGDFVMLADEVDGVIEALRENGIAVVSLHNHMLHEEPRLFFTHFWADGDPLQLARGLSAALDHTAAR